jgi:hypothetical protein
MLYFLIHDAESFYDRIAPAVAASWRQRTFRPLAALAEQFQSTVAAFSERFHLTADEQPLLSRLTAEQPFDRRLWRHLSGELLLYTAADVPTIQTAGEELSQLVTADQRDFIHQAQAGSRDLAFDGVPYRSGHAGVNDTEDVARLAEALAAIDPSSWTVPGDDDAAEELAFASAYSATLREMYERAAANRQIVICEDV